MKLKNFKKQIETTLFKRICNEKKYILFLSNIKNNLANSYNVLNYSLKHSLQTELTTKIINNFLKLSFFSNINDLNFFIKNLKNNTNLIYFIKIKNLYIYNFNSDFKTKFSQINISAEYFVIQLQKIFLGWLPSLKAIIKESSK